MCREATGAGVLLGFAVPVAATERFEHLWRPVSAAVAVPVFAFFAAGVPLAGGLGLGDPVTVGVVVGLVAGKTVGVTGAALLVRRLIGTTLGMSRWDLLGLALLGGVGFTVSMLIGELAFGAGSVRDQHAKLGILLGSLIAALSAAVLLRVRDRRYRRSG